MSVAISIVVIISKSIGNYKEALGHDQLGHRTKDIRIYIM